MRPTWDEYFLGIAHAVSARGECSRRQVGSIIVNTEHRILGAGYNGAEPGAKSCLQGACPRAFTNAEPGVSSYTEGETRCIAIHAERNAIHYVKKYHGEDGCMDTTLYCTDLPCYMCSDEILASGVVGIVTPRGTMVRGAGEWLPVPF